MSSTCARLLPAPHPATSCAASRSRISRAREASALIRTLELRRTLFPLDRVAKETAMGQFLLTVPYETSPTDPDSYAGARVLRMILLSVGVTPLPVDQMYSHAAAYDDPGEPVP